MMDVLGQMVAVGAGLVIVVGALYRFVLLPNLREQLFKPVQETNKAVTENGGRNDPPTVPDKLHALQTSVDVLAEQIAVVHAEASAAAEAARKAEKAATEQRKEIDLAQTVLLEHIKGHTHDD